jgi:C-terminal processing protease CtpA/Prc
LIFDYPHSRLILEPREPAVPPSEHDMSGMYLLADGPDLRRFVVREIVPGGPAAQAGVQVGDLIVAAGGRTAASLTLSALRRLLRSRDGRDVALDVERGGARLTLTVRLRRLV